MFQSNPASQDVQKHLAGMPTKGLIQNQQVTSDTLSPITSLGIISKLRASFLKFMGFKSR